MPEQDAGRAGKVVITETTTIVPVPPTTTIPVDTKALFQFSPQTPEVLQTVFFNASTSVPGSDRTITNYSWDFGDGVSKTGLTTNTISSHPVSTSSR